ncbi:hypothetical protein K492DRAFT_69810 [Lichtheimia hyalospora FSU 10163]|nr:hypothetical protein K492DRAFT_69810 [Lichtheimia hyalospora FSU 10163]
MRVEYDIVKGDLLYDQIVIQNHCLCSYPYTLCHIHMCVCETARMCESCTRYKITLNKV